VPEASRWGYIRQYIHESHLSTVLNKALDSLENANKPLLDGVLRHIDFTRNIGRTSITDQGLSDLLKYLSKYRLCDEDFESPNVLGDAFEYLINQFADLSGKKGGEFYTPRDVVKLMVRLTKPAEGMRVYDPCVGSGGMLIYSRQFVEENGGHANNLDLFGQDNNGSTWATCKLNMIFHGIPNADIANDDTLTHPAHKDSRGTLMRFDRILSNPPFSQNYQINELTFKDRFRFGYTSSTGMKADLMFLQHMIAVLEPNGIAASIMPNGVLFRGGAEKKIRQGIIEHDLLEAVIALPANLFYGTGIPACILVLRHEGAKPSQRQGKVLFIDAESEYVSKPTQNYLSPEHIEKITITFETFQSLTGYSSIVTNEELAANDWNLNIIRYIEKDLIGLQLNRYRLLETIGKGILGETYLAEDTRLGNRQIAVKVFRIEALLAFPGSSDTEITRSFRNRVSEIARLQHSSIASLNDYGEVQIGSRRFLYIVMPYYNDESFLVWLSKNHISPSFQDVSNWITQMAEATQYAHDLKILHGAIKPSNILVSSKNHLELLLSDFVPIDWNVSYIESTNIINEESSYYIAPEQWTGQIVPATDQYALAVVAYRLLTGHYPFEGSVQEVRSQHIYIQPSSPSKFNLSLPKTIDNVFQSALAKKPQERYSSIFDFANALREALQNNNNEVINLYFSYALEDQKQLEELIKPLSPLREQEIINWPNHKTSNNHEWIVQADIQLNDAKLILLLIGAEYLESNYDELLQAMERYETRLSWVIPIILRPTDWKASPFARLEVLPKGGKPISEIKDSDKIFLDVAHGIQEVIEELRQSPRVISSINSSPWPKTASAQSFKLYYSYSEADQALFEKLEKKLSTGYHKCVPIFCSSFSTV
jgi:type I restriction system adenine methylase HsdM